MRCPGCGKASLHPRATNADVVDVCGSCQGVWLERGQVGAFASDPRAVEKQFANLRDRKPGNRRCPHCEVTLDRGRLPDRPIELDACPSCGGVWFDAGELTAAVGGDAGLDLRLRPADEPEPVIDEAAKARAQERMQALSVGILGLPNLYVRSALTLGLLYAMLGAALIAVAQLGYMSTGVAVLIGVVIIVLQYALGPWFMDLMLRWLYRMTWVAPEQLPPHLASFIRNTCEKERMKFPSVALIHDGAPTAFTYGHHPNNARVAISQGLIDLLAPDELEAVVGHELGHARNWDMALMTLANLVPLLLFYLYDIALRFRSDKGKDYSGIVAAGAYVLYIISEYVVLWFSRTREYYADRFAGEATGNPNALARALVKIAYGLAAQGSTAPTAAPETDEAKKEAAAAKERTRRIDALGALNVFDRHQAVSLVVAAPTRAGTAGPDVEMIKGAMQWDLWNPWGTFYELNSTHPLTAKRLTALADQAAALGQEPLVVFDRAKPESYWDEFFVDLTVMVLPWVGFLIGLAGFLVHLFGTGSPRAFAWLGGGIALAGLGSLLKTFFSYRKDFFPHLSVAALLHKVKVSAVRPVPTTLTGTIIGKGVPGLVFSEDFVIRDKTGILFLDYRQPLAIWNFFFGLWRADRYQGKDVRVTGWYRRAPVPYLEINRLDVIDGSEPPRRCYTYYAKLIGAGVLMAIGAVMALFAVWV